MIKAIIFDLGGVLFTDGSKKFKETISKRYGIDYEKVKSVIEGGIGTEYRKGKVTRDEFWRVIKEELGIEDNIDDLENEWIASYDLIEGTKEIIFDLAKKYKVYYLSDNIRERVEKLNSLHSFLEWFEDGIFSHDVGVRKPDPAIYEFVLEKIKVKPEEVLFIDDKESNLSPAKQLGMRTILFRNPESLREKLRELELL